MMQLSPIEPAKQSERPGGRTPRWRIDGVPGTGTKDRQREIRWWASGEDALDELAKLFLTWHRIALRLMTANIYAKPTGA